MVHKKPRAPGGVHQQEGIMNLSKLWELVKDREAWHAAVHELQRVERLNDNNGFYFGDFKSTN